MQNCCGEKGYSTQKVDVIAVHVDDEPGGLGKALRALADQHLNVDYLYTFLDKSGDKAIVIMRVDNLDFATSILSRNGFKLLDQSDVMDL